LLPYVLVNDRYSITYSGVSVKRFIDMSWRIMTNITKNKTQQEEVDRNYKVFKKMLENLIESDKGRFALFHNEELIACFDTNRDAKQAAEKLIGDKPYSVQEITKKTVDLGYFSHASFVR